MPRLVAYDPAHLAALSALQLPAVQEQFTAYPADHILLVVNAHNAHARRVYEKAGYTVWFQRDGGEYGPQRVMEREVV